MHPKIFFYNYVSVALIYLPIPELYGAIEDVAI